MQTFVARDGQQIGIWEEDELRQLYAQGQLLPSDYYWRSGMADWGTLDQVMEGEPLSAGPAELTGGVNPTRTSAPPASSRRSSPPRWLVPVFLGLTAVGVVILIVSAIHVVRQQLSAKKFVGELRDFAAQRTDVERKQAPPQELVATTTNSLNVDSTKPQQTAPDDSAQDRTLSDESAVILQQIKDHGEACHAAEKEMLTLGFNPSRLTSPEEIEKRRQVIQGVLPVLTSMVDFLQNLDQQVRADLQSKGVSAAKTDNFLASLRQTGNQHNLLVYWQQESAICGDLLANLDVLRSSYGQWHVKDDKVLFEDPAILAQYQSNVSKLRADIDTQKAAQSAALQPAK